MENKIERIIAVCLFWSKNWLPDWEDLEEIRKQAEVIVDEFIESNYQYIAEFLQFERPFYISKNS